MSSLFPRPPAGLRLRRHGGALALFCLIPALASAAGTGALSGRVESTSGAPIAGARVELLDAAAEALTGPDGRFRFEGLSSGVQLVLAEAAGHESALESVRVPAGGEATLELHLGRVRQLEEQVIVTGTPFGRSADEVYQAASVLEGVDLAAALQPTLGETLAAEPGVSSTWFGPVAGRPLIRGQGGDRIRILQDGIGAGDASAASPDHAVSVDPFAAERIEVIRGPATLLYGSSAVGGVVNVFEDRIARRRLAAPLIGRLQLRGGTADDQLGGAFSIDAGTERLVVHADALARDAGELDTPAGRLANSWSEARGGALGLSLVGDRGHVGLSHGLWDTSYGSPAEADVSIELEQRRSDLSFERRFDGRVRALRLRAGLRDYEHVEWEGDEVGTRFLSDFREGRADVVLESGDFSATLGLQGTTREFEAIGEESFVPFTRTVTLGAFGLAEWSRRPWAVQLGGRVETRSVKPRAGERRRFEGLSASLGLRREWRHGLSLTGTVSRSVKLPAAEELFSDGPHLATDRFELGDPSLDEEEALSFELTFRRSGERFDAELALFHSSFDGYIHESATGELREDLPVFAYRQSDATFRGGELGFGLGLLESDPHALRLELSVQHVEAERAGDIPLPRIPPLQARLGLRGERGAFWGELSTTWTDRQGRVEPGETPTAGHSRLDLTLGLRRFVGDSVHDLVLRASNLTDALARQHPSFLKDSAPLPGRDLSLTWRWGF